MVELELIQTQMTQKPMLRTEVYARALRASQNRKEDSVAPIGGTSRIVSAQAKNIENQTPQITTGFG